MTERFFIFDKLITDIKSKLPLKKKKVEEEIEESENSSDVDGDGTEASVLGDKTSLTDVSEVETPASEDAGTQSRPLTLIDKLKSKIVSLKKSPAPSDSTDAADSTGVVKKKGLNPIVLGLIVLGIGSLWFFDDEPTQETAAPEASSSFKRPVRKKPVKTEEPKAEGPKAEEPKAEEPKAEEPTAEEPTAEEPKAEEPKAEEPKAEEPKVEEPKVEEPKVDEPQVEEATTASGTDIPVIEETTKPSDEAVISENPNSSGDTVGEGAEPSGDGTITDKILEDLEQQVKNEKPKEVIKEYVSPPDYEYRGRGLVYNCAGKHWACVDAPSYKMCENNFSSINYLKKKVECYPANIYESTKGCELMQNRNVSSNQKTEFCNGN